MLIIYIALVFILLGVAFFALSAKTERRQIPAGQPMSAVTSGRGGTSPSSTHPAPGAVRTKTPSFSVQEHVFYRDDAPKEQPSAGLQPAFQEEPRSQVAAVEKQAVSESGYSPVDELRQTMDESIVQETAPPDGIAAVLFEDADSVVAYGEGSDSIAPERYSHLKRLSNGILIVGDDALTFRSEKALYRFDFHRLKQIRGDAGSVLIYPDTMNHPLLLLCPDDKTVARTIIDRFITFRKGRP
ncbi:MAG: hypothetical protein ACOC2H_06295 [Spirochaetota bacterium]